MLIEVLKSKIHCARVTEANLNYMGSITIDEDLLDAANMIAMANVSRPTSSRASVAAVASASMAPPPARYSRTTSSSSCLTH